MNAPLAYITASNAASISVEDFYVTVTRAISSTLMEEPALVSKHDKSYYLLAKLIHLYVVSVTWLAILMIAVFA